jgi:hypothetical protein
MNVGWAVPDSQCSGSKVCPPDQNHRHGVRNSSVENFSTLVERKGLMLHYNVPISTFQRGAIRIFINFRSTNIFRKKLTD